MRRASMRDIAAEGALLAGGGTAILLQIAEPTVAAGVAAHSDFASRPLERLRATLTYVYTVVFGTEAEVAAVRAMVDRAHAPVSGATDPQLQLWVAATLYATGADLDERIWGPLDARSAEQVYRDNSVLGTALQMPAELWPEDLRAFRRYWDRRIGELTVTPDARRICLDLLHPRTLPWWLRPAMPLVRLLTAGLLPPGVRAAYGLPWSRLRERRFRRTLRPLAAAYRAVPAVIRRSPMRHYTGRVPSPGQLRIARPRFTVQT